MFLRSHHKSATIYLRGHKEIETPHNPHSHSKLGTDSKLWDHNLTRMSSSWMKSWMMSWNWTFFPTQHMEIKTESKKRRNRERRNVTMDSQSEGSPKTLFIFFWAKSTQKWSYSPFVPTLLSLFVCPQLWAYKKIFFTKSLLLLVISSIVVLKNTVFVEEETLTPMDGSNHPTSHVPFRVQIWVHDLGSTLLQGHFARNVIQILLKGFRLRGNIKWIVRR